MVSRYLMGTTRKRVPIYQPGCPAQTVIEVLANKWALFVLAALREQGTPVRFTELRRMLGTVTQKMLTQTLRALERDGLVRRDVYPTVPPRVEYSITPLGVGIGELTNAVGEWAQSHARTILAARADYDERAALAPTPVA
jgi:DNA-binding HxlR family transcriptional regulator